MASRPPPTHHSAYSQGLNRANSPLLTLAVPWLSVMLGTLAPQWLAIASAPFMPPFGFLMFIAWRQLHPGLLPVWAGLPLGMFDDLFSGQPFGCAILLWSVTMIGMEVIEDRYPWRSFFVDWLSASAIILAYTTASLGLGNAGSGHVTLPMIMPQILLSILVYPLVGRVVGWLDIVRLLRFRKQT